MDSKFTVTDGDGDKCLCQCRSVVWLFSVSPRVIVECTD